MSPDRAGHGTEETSFELFNKASRPRMNSIKPFKLRSPYLSWAEQYCLIIIIQQDENTYTSWNNSDA